ncbi:MAG: TBC domain-containing protein [Promethearchaeia archaeon]
MWQQPAEEAQWASNSDDTSGETGARGEKRIGKSELQQVVNHLLERSEPPSPCAQQMRCAAHNAQPSTEDQRRVPPGEAPSPFASAQAKTGAADTTDEQTVHQISLDLERTFPGLILLQANQGALYAELRAVLFAVACERARLGYVQGMSHLAALLLLYMPACDAFVSLVRLLDTAPHLAPFFHVDMEEISRFAAALHVMLAIHRPAIAARIRRTGVDARLFVLKWWITCFVSVFPPHHVSCLWDRFLCQGISSLVCFTMALLEHVCAVHSTHMNQWDKALSLLTHIEDYDIDMDAVFAGMDELQEAGGVGGLLPINDETFMDLVTNPTPRAPPDDAAAVGSIVGLHVPCRIGLRVELLDKIALVMADGGESVNSTGDREALAMPALESQGIGTVTQVEQEGAVVVAWDNGNVHSCRAGLLSEFWLKLSFADFG